MSLKNFISYEDAEEVLGEYADKVNELKSGLTNVADDVKLNTNDLTTPSRSKNAINILDKASETINGVTAVCSGGVITVTGESSGDAEFYFSLGTPLVLDPALYKIAFNNTATNQYMAIRFRNSSTTLLNWAPNVENRIVENWQDSVTCDRISIAIPNGYFTEMSISITVLDKTETDPTFAPYIPSVDARLDAVESGLDDVNNNLSLLSGETIYTTDSDIASDLYGNTNYVRHVIMKDTTKTMALLNAIDRGVAHVILLCNRGIWPNHPNFIALVNTEVFVGVLNITSTGVSVVDSAKLAWAT